MLNTRSKNTSKSKQPRDFSAAPPPARGQTAPSSRSWKNRWKRQQSILTKLKWKSTNWFTSLNNHACDAHGKKFLFKEDMQSIYSIAQREFDLKCPSVPSGFQRQDDIWNTFFNNAKNSLMIKLRSFCNWYQKSWNKIMSIAGIFQKANLDAAVAYCEVIRLSEMTKQKHFKEVRAKLIQTWKQSAKLKVKLLLSKIFNFTYISKWASEIYSSHVKKLTHLESLYRGCWHQTCPPIDPR